MKIAIDKIRIMERLRKEIIKIDELASDIKLNGLLNPVTVMPLDGGEFRLLAGLRRIKAAQLLGWKEIEVNPVSPADAEAALRIEISENEQREPFTFTEKVDFGMLLEEIEAAKAKERMAEGGKGGLTEGAHPGAYLAQGRSRDIIGAKIGMCGFQYDCAKYVAANAEPEVIDQLDKGERTIRRTYRELRAKEKAEKPPAAKALKRTDPESKPRGHTSQEPQAQIPTINEQKRSSASKMHLQELKAQEAEHNRIAHDFMALSPEGKIAELQRQLREERSRAADAESELTRLKELRHNDIMHKDSIVESLKRQNAELNDALTVANARIRELEAAYGAN